MKRRFLAIQLPPTAWMMGARCNGRVYTRCASSGSLRSGIQARTMRKTIRVAEAAGAVEGLDSGGWSEQRRPCFGFRKRATQRRRYVRLEMAMVMAPLKRLWMAGRVERRPDRR